MSEKVLVTRFCRLAEDGTLRSDYNNFRWPRSGPVSCNDWSPLPQCGKGLHGWLWGKGDPSAWGCQSSDVMLVVEVDRQDIVNLQDKVKFPFGDVIFAGSREEVTKYMANKGHVGLVYGNMTVGDSGVAEVGGSGMAMAGRHGMATAGDYGNAMAGDYGNAMAGRDGHAMAGVGGTATADDYGLATAGYRGTATAGDHGTATAGVGGTATAGDGGTATAGYGGTATAGDGGQIRIEWHDQTTDRYRTAVGYIGENGLKPNTPYKVDNSTGKFVEVWHPV